MSLSPFMNQRPGFSVYRTIRYRHCWSYAALLLVLMIAGCEKSDGKAPGQGAQGAPAPQVGVVTVDLKKVELTTQLPGRTAAFRIAEVRPQVSGVILKRMFEEGKEVKEGQQLFQIDPARYQAAYDSAKATLARAEAVQQSAKLTVDRYKKLEIGRDISTQDYDNAVAALMQAEADILAAKAAIETARINLDYTKVYSPISGRTGRSNVTEGALVTADQATALVTVQQLDPIYVDVTQSTTELQRLRNRMASGHLQRNDAAQSQVKLLMDDNVPYTQNGSLQFREVTVDPTTGSVVLRMVFPNPNQTLLPGMFVRAVVEEGIQPQAMLIPQQTVSRDTKGNPVVFVVNDENKIEQRQIVLDRAVGGDWLVTSGLSAGQRVVAEGAQRVRPGALVNAIPFDPNAGPVGSGNVGNKQ